MEIDDPAPAAKIDRLTRLIELSGIGPAVSPSVRERARGHALELLAEGGSGEGAVTIAMLACTADILCEIAVDLAARPREARRLIYELEQIAGFPTAALGREVLRTPSLPQLSTDVAIEVQLALSLAFAEVDAISLWTLSAGGDLVYVAHAGVFEPQARGSGRAASALLAGAEPAPAAGSEFGIRPPAGSEVGIRIDRWLHPAAALVAHGEPPRADHRVLLLESAAPVFGSILERDALRAREQSSGESVVTSVERRLARLRFDLHDGPQQDVHLLAQDLRSFRDQLRPVIAEDPNTDRLLGRLDDFEAQLVALDGDLRRISTSVQSPFVHPGSIPERLRQITDAFAARSGVEPQTRFEGDLTKLSESQQIALLALIREALSNVREHSDAGKVTIAVSSDAVGVEVEVTDDGRGFDPETTLVRAAREGHLGLVGMHERVRMLGGRTRIDSRPGGPTVISASLPSWPSQPKLG
jgi:signal transduction histidine kinase